MLRKRKFSCIQSQGFPYLMLPRRIIAKSDVYHAIETMGIPAIYAVPNLLKDNEGFLSLGMRNLHSPSRGFMTHISTLVAKRSRTTINQMECSHLDELCGYTPHSLILYLSTRAKRTEWTSLLCQFPEP